MRISICCPICATRASARTSRKLSDTLREIRYRCENDDCGHIYVAHLEVVYTVVPSALENPAVELPLSPHRQSNRAQTG
ncbi:ogr/Delta-like zinc finger family protein [Paraburkholderia fungorum]|uniref:ogr/Delta-like zinc finger family protein n=1 Tax=Paraburkholderia TaxID=1822464 RepID=UPI00190A1141|nr:MULTISPECIES: ogr/Delta-like zinc finger family protein [Paraburkholderia]MBK3814254.1 ogr/Delta-like zinc finger family protein [Paraburkholderia aspalathi]